MEHEGRIAPVEEFELGTHGHGAGNRGAEGASPSVDEEGGRDSRSRWDGKRPDVGGTDSKKVPRLRVSSLDSPATIRDWKGRPWMLRGISALMRGFWS